MHGGVDPKTGTATAELAFLSPKIAIAAGMVGQVSIKTHPHETIRIVSEWYYAYYREQRDMYAFTLDQITDYELIAEDRNRIWTKL